MKREKAMIKMWKAHLNGDNPSVKMNKVMDKIYADHEKEVKQLKERITELEWKTDVTRWGA